MTTDNSLDSSSEIEVISRRLQALEEEKFQFLSRKATLETAASNVVAISSALSLNDEVTLFQKFFVGCDDIYVFRLENKQAKSGYAVACHNEWHTSNPKLMPATEADPPHTALMP